MNAQEAIALIRRHEAELRRLGVQSLSLFGSTARGEAAARADIDVAVKLEDIAGGFATFGRLDRIRERLGHVLQARVDVVLEPAEPGVMRTAVEKDRRVAF
jgi:hypothetical protein